MLAGRHVPGLEARLTGEALVPTSGNTGDAGFEEEDGAPTGGQTRRVKSFLKPSIQVGGCWWEVGGGLTGRLRGPPPRFPRPLPGRGWVSHGAHLSAQQVPRLPGGGDAGDTWGSAHAQTRGRGPDVLPGEPGKEPASGSFGIRQPRPSPSDHSLCARELGGESGGNVRPSRPSRA